jgi:hypothetical protein
MLRVPRDRRLMISFGRFVAISRNFEAVLGCLPKAIQKDICTSLSRLFRPFEFDFKRQSLCRLVES